ncbi:OsmC family peroxiredoxin [Entomomonas asaccharolytica]|uniref:OsmC family peroxiredoxin n=1 Tax=Entomomonas asaccharolytica TaxID=2785331 RepID=A0A974NH90_9GAMM|nr:OsmC family peroxiredoxin [Entomomonas asaccharolytica]QQP86327.1 OsmC family peroxiredoxin [Entomomonas asaccharolytica]
MKQSAIAIWEGSRAEGKGVTTTQSKQIYNTPYSFVSHFDDGHKQATNPAELIAAAHADCFTLMLTELLEKTDLVADYIETSAEVTIDFDSSTMTHSHLTVKARIPNISKDQFAEMAITAAKTCPVSRLLKAEISVDYELI